jgi:hypothetical protein
MHANPIGEAASLPSSDLPADSFANQVSGDEGGQHLAATPDPVATSPVLDRLRARYTASRGARRKSLMILPGRYGNLLGVRLMPMPDDIREGQGPKMLRAAQSGSEEAQLNAAAEMIVACTETILLRDEETGELKPMHEAVDEYAGQTPVLWDDRLLAAVGLDVPSEYVSPERVVRMVWSNKAALGSAVQALQAFLTEDDAGDTEADADPL